MNKMQAWTMAARLRTLPLAVTCVLLGAALAQSSGLGPEAQHQFTVVVAGAMLTVILLQVLANFANDYGDYKKGTDTAAGRQDRALASGLLAPQSMKQAMGITAVLAFATGITTLCLSFVPAFGAQETGTEAMWMALLGTLGTFGIVAAIRYTVGTQSYGYKGFGDVYVMLFFGFVGVLGVGLLVAHEWHGIWTLPALFSGCMSVAVLNLNNLRDHVKDAESGKRTMVVQLGFEGGKRYHLLLLAVGWSSLAVFFQAPSQVDRWHGTMWYVLIALVHARHAVQVWQCKDPALLDPELKRVALSSFLVALFMFMDQTVVPT